MSKTIYLTYLTCEFCNRKNETVKPVLNPFDECQELLLCEICEENAYDNAREAPNYGELYD